MWYFIALCFLIVDAQNLTDSVVVNNSESAKVEPKNISSLYIGDLLRTKPKEDLEVAGSVHEPILLNKDLLSAASALDHSLPYKSHGGHEYSEADPTYHPRYSEGRAAAYDVVKRTGTQARSVPINVKGHLLTLKPVRLVSTDNFPAPRNVERSHKDEHYPGDECSKNRERSYSSEEKTYVPEQPSYRIAKHTASNPELEYRNRESSYYEDDRSDTYSSHSDPSSAGYSSKTYPSDTSSKSQTAGSYTTSKSTSSTSKSTSSSKTLSPNKPKTHRIIAPVVSNRETYNKNYGPVHKNYSPAHTGQGVVVYKMKEPSSHRPSSYPESSEKEYPPSEYDKEDKPAVREPHYDQYSSGPKKSRKLSRGKPTHYSSSEPKDRPQQYGPSSYEQSQDSYDQSSYTRGENQGYREQNKPSNNHNENQYSHRPNQRGPETKPYQQNYPVSSSTPSYYNAEQKIKSPHNKKELRTQYSKKSNRGREQAGYRSRGHPTPDYDYSQEHQPIRSQKEIPQHDYESYPTQYGPAEASPSPLPYDNTESALRAPEKQVDQYQYETTPHKTNTKHADIYPSHKRPLRESARYARSPEQPSKSVAMKGRSQMPVSGTEPVVLISRESKPFVSRSESSSESSYGTEVDMRGFENPKASYSQKDKLQTNEGRNAGYPSFQTPYKPFNSEYPASYVNDQHHNVAGKHRSRAYERPFPQTQSHTGPVYSKTQSHTKSSAGPPQQYQSYQDGQSYEQDGSADDSYEQEEKPVKNGKNHHYISKVEGYKDTYAKDEPLVIDEEFFRKYGISPTAKVIVANAENPNLFVADGTNIKEGEFFGNSGSGPSSGPNSGPSSGPSSDASYESQPESGYGPSSTVSEGDNYDPNYKEEYKEDSYSSSPEDFGGPKQLPGSFDDLVDTNPKFLRNLPQFMKNDDSFFRMDSTEESFAGVEFPKVGEQRGYIVSQGPGEIVQQHGDGISRIVFNIPKGEAKEETSNVFKLRNKGEIDEEIVEAATELIKNIIKSNS